MRTALIGYSGFVGSNLRNSFDFDDHYNTANIEEIAGRSYDLVVTAANRADSHRINQEPDVDFREVKQLCELLTRAKIKKLVLISTVCVYPGGSSPVESTPLSPEGLTPYGVNRLWQEQRLANAFDVLVLRLPQLYGANLRKGVIYDLINNYRTEFIDPRAEFQYYDVRNLWKDIQTALRERLQALNVASPPIASGRLAEEVFGIDLWAQSSPPPAASAAGSYTRDMRTEHGHVMGRPNSPYLDTHEESLSAIKAYVNEEQQSEGAQSA